MSTPIIVAIDEGTTNAKAICINQDGQILAKGSRPLQLTHPRAGWSEQDPMAIVNAVQEAVAEAVSKISDAQIMAVAISNQRESVLIWDRETGEALTPVVSWQCRRSAEFCQKLADSPDAAVVQQKTGLPIDPLFPGAKISLLLDAIPDGRARAKQKKIGMGTIDSWLVWHLSGQQSFVTDHSNASRTQLFNINQQCWDEELLKIFNVPVEGLAEVINSSALRAETQGFTGLADGIPILSQIGDSHAALYGQGGFIPGVIKATYGTGSSLMTPVDEVSGDDYRLGRTIAWHDGALTYALEGNITHTGAAVGWMAKMLGITDIDQFASLASSVDSNDGVYFVPALSGMGAPHWNSQARGVICGLTDNANPAILARASLEAVAYQIADVFNLMEAMAGRRLDTLLVDGGPTRNLWLMQFQADLLQRQIMRSTTEEVSAIGAGYLAGKALGWWKTRDDLAALQRQVEIIEPSSSREGLTDSYSKWQQAVERTLFNPS